MSKLFKTKNFLIIEGIVLLPILIIYLVAIIGVFSSGSIGGSLFLFGPCFYISSDGGGPPCFSDYILILLIISQFLSIFYVFSFVIIRLIYRLKKPKDNQLKHKF